MPMISDADKRVLSYLRKRGRAGVASIGAECFLTAGKPRRSGSFPASAHLARMAEKGLIRRVGGLYEAVEQDQGGELFGVIQDME